MKLHYAGKYSGNESDLPQREHMEGAVPFREAKTVTSLAIGMNIAAFILIIICTVCFVLRQGKFEFSFLGAILSLVFIVPHEFLHAICFHSDVYLYQNLKQGILFVVGTEEMSKAHFIMMSLLPNIIFGIIPFVIAMVFPSQTVLATLGIISIGEGAGDYYNVFNALTQMPKGARTYICGFHSYWYIPTNRGGR